MFNALYDARMFDLNSGWAHVEQQLSGPVYMLRLGIDLARAICNRDNHSSTTARSGIIAAPANEVIIGVQLSWLYLNGLEYFGPDTLPFKGTPIIVWWANVQTPICNASQYYPCPVLLAQDQSQNYRVTIQFDNFENLILGKKVGPEYQDKINDNPLFSALGLYFNAMPSQIMATASPVMTVIQENYTPVITNPTLRALYQALINIVGPLKRNYLSIGWMVNKQSAPATNVRRDIFSVNNIKKNTLKIVDPKSPGNSRVVHGK